MSRLVARTPQQPTPRPDRLSIATLAKVHGIRGELKLRCSEAHVSLLRELAEQGETITLVIPDTGDEYEVTFAHVRGHESAPIVAIDGVDDRTAAESFRGAHVLVDRTMVDEPGDDEYFLADLVGCAVHDAATGERVGITTKAEALPANVVVTITLESGSTVLAPLADIALPLVDVEARRIDVDLAYLGVELESVDEDA